MNFENSKKYRETIHNLIPGGSHTYSKGDDQFPAESPAAIKRGKGVKLWDVDGNEFLDCGMGLASVSLGHAFEPILEPVIEELQNGINFPRPSHLELKAAKAFLDLLPMHDMIKFAKNGSTLTTAAVKLARAYTGRKLVAFPGNHPFYSYDDWFIGKTNCNLGVPDEIAALSVTFNACDLNSLQKLFDKYPDQIACVITEPEKNTCYSCNCQSNNKPENFLREAIEMTHRNGALFILDEMQSGFRSSFPGSITKFDLKPDMATWGKGIANGFSFSVLTGIKKVMDLGSIIRKGEEKTFLVSTTHGAETHSMVAGIETIRFFKENDVIKHNHSIGRLLINKTKALIKEKNLEGFIQVLECDWMIGFTFLDASKQVSAGMRTLFMQEMIKGGVLFQGIFVPCYSHTEEDIEFFSKAFNNTLEIYKAAIQEGYEKFLVGEPVKPVFRKLN